jgi:hypothetical protein
MPEVSRSAAGLIMYRGVGGPAAIESDFESLALDPTRKVIGHNARFDNIVSFFGVSVFSSVDALLRTFEAEWIAEVDTTKARGVLSLKTGRDPDHHDLMGDRGDMVECVQRVFQP